ncbi:MAG: anti-sigma factor antagonist, partial [Oscillospiraceae bacterium]|nr:anti-sigma factor antagonist [Oscillospiraceae bacterium]
MKVTYRVDENTLYLVVSGRIDASNAAAAEEQIFAIKAQNDGKRTVVDADELEYISSAGLRVVLKLRKEDPDLAIINVSSDVYEVLDMTGFTDMIAVEKAYPRMSVEGCEFIAKGANGAVYRYDDETIVKTYYAKDALDEIKQERENARRAFVLGINTAIPYGIVRVGDGYGTVTELLNATSITKMIRKDPDDLTLAAKYFIDMLKTIHSTEVEDGAVPDMKETAMDWAKFVSEHIPADQAQKLIALIEAVPKRNTLMHGDYHTNNIMVQNGEPLLIDMDTLCMGHPVFELGSMFNAFVGYAEVNHDEMMDFFGFSFETAGRFWEMALQMYLGT